MSVQNLFFSGEAGRYRMSSLTIVVPRLGSDAAFETTLASILRYRLPHHQVIVVQATDDVDDYGLGDEATFLKCPESASLAHFVSRAIPNCTGNVVSLILPGVEVNNQWFAPAMREMTQTNVGCVSIPVFVGEQHESSGLGINADFLPDHILEKHSRVAGPTQWAGCYRRTLLEQLDFMNDELGDELFGLEIGLAAKALGLRCLVAQSGGVTVDEKTPIALPRGFRSGFKSRRLQFRYLPGHRSVYGKIGAAVRFGFQLVQPTKWTYLAGRKSARRWQNADEGFATQLESLANRFQDSAEVNPGRHRSPRRAA